jgi:FAD/FMN-containing dehydrogenase
MTDINLAASLKNLTIISGGEASVAYGGYMTGAGHGALSATYGLAADQALELEIVTPGGNIVIANECQNQDLFWAMRGVSLLFVHHIQIH